jgi:hypothetical protein
VQSQILNEYTKTDPKLRLNQGDILKGVSIGIQSDLDTQTNEAIFSKITLAYAVVINQDCDLEQDFNNRKKADIHQDKFLPNILILPAYLSEQFRAGDHRGAKVKGISWGSDQWRGIIQNNNLRFHSIKANEEFQIPDLIVDFKHFYTVSRDVLYKDIQKYYLATVCELYREHLSHRYSHYLSRIGLPDQTNG